MGDTYDSRAEAQADREQLENLLVALGAWDRALRRDECGAWCISGKTGRVYTWGDGRTWMLFVACRSALHWTHTKRRLSFCTATQDGEDEGCLRLRTLPTPEQAAVLRDMLGIRKRLEFAPETLERLRARTAGWNEFSPCPEARLAPRIGENEMEGTEVA